MKRLAPMMNSANELPNTMAGSKRNCPALSENGCSDVGWSRFGPAIWFGELYTLQKVEDSCSVLEYYTRRPVAVCVIAGI